MRTALAIFLTGLFWAGFAHAQQREPMPEPDSDYASYGWTAFGPLHGVNLGNFLEAPTEGAWSDGRLLQANDFSIIKQAGFNIIRVPIRWAEHVGPAPDFTIDPAFFSRVDWVVAQAEKNDLTAILDYHNDDALMKDPDANGDRFVAIWKQIAAHYQTAPASIYFELLNEPNGKLDAPKWNNLLGRTLTVVRATNPGRLIVVGPVWWNSIGALDSLVLPESDQGLLVTVHFYDPMTFTHQGASWVGGSDKWLGNTWQGTNAEKLAVTQAFNKAAAWGKAHKWTAFVARTAESHGFPWTYWEFCSGFGAYDPQAQQWRQPLLDALRPPK
jgi:endoglucanase